MTGPLSAIGGTPEAARGDRSEQLRAAAQAFEAIFLRQMIGSMRQAKLAEDPFGSAGAEQFQDMADARLADNMARQGGFGIAEMLLKQFQGNSGR